MFCLRFYRQYLTFWSFCYCKKQIDAIFFPSVPFWQTYISWTRGPIQLSLEVDLLLPESNTVLDWGFHSIDYVFQVLDFSGTWILDSNRLWDSRFFELYSGFQNPGLRIPHTKIPWIPESGFLKSWASESESHSKVAPKAKFPPG